MGGEILINVITALSDSLCGCVLGKFHVLDILCWKLRNIIVYFLNCLYLKREEIKQFVWLECEQTATGGEYKN